MGISPAGGSDGGGGVTGGGYLRLPPPEHSHKVHCSQAHYGPVSDGGVTPGDKFVEALVVAGVSGAGGDVDGGSRRGNGGEIGGGVRG